MKIQDIVVQKKMIKNIGLEIVQKKSREIRKPEAKYQVRIDPQHSKRGNFA